MKNILSVIVVISVLLQMFSFTSVVSAQSSGNLGVSDGIDWFGLAKSKGCYIEADNLSGAVGMSVHDVNRLYDLKDATDAADFNNLGTANTASSLINSGKAYVADKGSDDAVKYTVAKSADNTEKTVWMTANNYKNRGTGSASAGYIYFKITNDTITKSDKKLYVVIEYLESGTGNLSMSYITNTGKSADGGTSGITPAFKRKGTNKWVTAVIPLDDACFSSTDMSILQSGCEFRINALKNITYISRVAIIKQSDVAPLYDYTYYAPETPNAAPTLWLVGSSSNENYSLDWSPREGWSMQLEQFFKTKTVTPLKSDGSYQTGTDSYGEIDTVTDGVTIITKAKGGKSTRTFLSGEDPSSGITDDKRWDDIKQNAKQGDYILIDLGSNDSSSTRAEVWTNTLSPSDNDGRSYRANLAEFVKVARELKLNVIFITPKCNRTFSNGKIVDGIEAARLSMHDMGRLYGVPVLSVGEEHIELTQQLGEEYSKLIFAYFNETEYPDLNSSVSRTDSTHMNNTGAREVCKIIVNQLEANKDKYQSVANLYKWVDTTVDTSPISIPHKQSEKIEHDFDNVLYTVDGEQSDDIYKGEVTVSLDVKNTSDGENTAMLFAAVYDKDNKLIDISKSDPVTLGVGETKNLVSGAVTFPGYDGYTFRKFVWSSKLAPFDEALGGIKLTADGYHRRAVLKWSVDESIADGATYDIYRNDMYIASTKNGGYIDEQAPRGENAYQINVKDANGEVVAQSVYAIAKVTSMYDLKNTKGVYFSAAHINSKNEAENINHGISIVDGYPLVPAKDAAEYFGINESDYYLDGKYYLGLPFVSNYSDGSMRVVRAVDANGTVKNAYQTSTFYRYKDEKKVNYSCIYFKETEECENIDSHRNYTIFVEYMGKRSPVKMEYISSTLDANGKNTTKSVTASSVSQSGEWCIARFDITDAQFVDDTSFAEESVIRFRADDRDLYISSVLMVNNDICPKSADQVFAELNNMNFYDSKLRNASKLYPNGISVQFADGKAVSDGIDIYYSTSGTSDNRGEIAQAPDGNWYYSSVYVDNNGSAKQTNLFFKLDKDYLTGLSDKNAVMEITYKADYDTNIRIGTRTVSDGSVVNSIKWKNFAVKKNTEDNWQTLTVPLSDVWFVNRDNGASTVRMNIAPNTNDHNQQLKVKKFVVKNADHIPVDVTDVKSTGQSDKMPPKIYIAAASQSAHYTDEQIAQNGIYGWGMFIGEHISDKIEIINKGAPGTSTKTYPHFEYIYSNIKEGDYVILGSLYNDSDSSKPERYVTIEQYKTNYRNIVNTILKKKAVPVFLTSQPQMQKSTGCYIDVDNANVTPYKEAMIELANELDVAIVDISQMMYDDEKNLTPDEKRAMYVDEGWNNLLHFTQQGAQYTAELIAKGLKENTNVLSDYITAE